MPQAGQIQPEWNRSRCALVRSERCGAAGKPKKGDGD